MIDDTRDTDTRVRDERERGEKHDHGSKDIPGRALAAVFASREEAKRALGALHKAHFTKTWFGTTSVATTNDGDATLTAEPQGGSGFFSRDSKGLVDALVAQDVDGDTARRIEAEAEPGCAIVTVRPPDDGKHDPNEALEILSRYGGQVAGRAVAGSLAGSGRPSSFSAGERDAPDDLTWEEETFYQRL